MRRRLAEHVGQQISQFEWEPRGDFLQAMHREAIDWKTVWLVGCVAAERFVVTKFVGAGSDGFGWEATDLQEMAPVFVKSFKRGRRHPTVSRELVAAERLAALEPAGSRGSGFGDGSGGGGGGGGSSGSSGSSGICGSGSSGSSSTDSIIRGSNTIEAAAEEWCPHVVAPVAVLRDAALRPLKARLQAVPALAPTTAPLPMVVYGTHSESQDECVCLCACTTVRVLCVMYATRSIHIHAEICVCIHHTLTTC